MKIMFINSVYKYGSTGRLVEDLKNVAKENNFEVLVAYGRFKQKHDLDAFYFGNSIGQKIHYAFSYLLGRHGLHSSFSTKKLIRKIKQFKPDIIHLHNIHGYYLNYKLLFKFLNQSEIKVYWTLHDCWSFSGSSAHFDYFGCKHWDLGCVVCNNTNVYPKAPIYINQEKNFNLKRQYFTSLNNLTIITVSQWLQNLTSETFLNKFPIKKIYNGINLETFKNNQLKSKDIINLLGVANDWTDQKGLQDFNQLADLLTNNYKITLVGLEKNQFPLVSDKIIKVEKTKTIEELVTYYSQAHIYLNLSVEETMGLTSAEALACQTPVIVYNKTATPEIIDDSCGVVVEANDIKALYNTIINFDFDKYSKENCLKRSKLFSIEIMKEKHLNLYKKS